MMRKLHPLCVIAPQPQLNYIQYGVDRGDLAVGSHTLPSSDLSVPSVLEYR